MAPDDGERPADGAGAGPTGPGGDPRGDPRLAVAGGVAVLAAVVGYLVVRALVAAGTLGGRVELLALPAVGLLGAAGVVLLVVPFLTR
ncbi:hypothetical protein [Halobaculum lipolyticum]|uniref:Uncharacterized protein n=1 Tax=Halobaculum lipolyticum TaxID=3032001 RepID=A0ABD5WGG8_9EURY|nr:hypothetical protein [Halobaculum sp. DT31]